MQKRRNPPKTLTSIEVPFSFAMPLNSCNKGISDSFACIISPRINAQYDESGSIEVLHNARIIIFTSHHCKYYYHIDTICVSHDIPPLFISTLPVFLQ